MMKRCFKVILVALLVGLVLAGCSKESILDKYEMVILAVTDIGEDSVRLALFVLEEEPSEPPDKYFGKYFETCKVYKGKEEIKQLDKLIEGREYEVKTNPDAIVLSIKVDGADFEDFIKKEGLEEIREQIIASLMLKVKEDMLAEIPEPEPEEVYEESEPEYIPESEGMFGYDYDYGRKSGEAVYISNVSNYTNLLYNLDNEYGKYVFWDNTGDLAIRPMMEFDLWDENEEVYTRGQVVLYWDGINGDQILFVLDGIAFDMMYVLVRENYPIIQGAFDEGGMRLKEGYKIQVMVADVDNDSDNDNEILFAIGNGLHEMALCVMDYRGVDIENYALDMDIIGYIEGQSEMIIKDKLIYAPIGSQGLSNKFGYSNVTEKIEQIYD